jgi:hypothetical protein
METLKVKGMVQQKERWWGWWMVKQKDSQKGTKKERHLGTQMDGP